MPRVAKGGNAVITASDDALGAEQPQRVFDQRLQRLHEACGVPAVDDAVIAGQRQVHPLADRDLAVNKVEEKVVVVDGEIEVRKRMNLSLSCDHRVVDGWDAASFMQALKGYIENPLRLLSA